MSFLSNKFSSLPHASVVLSVLRHYGNRLPADVSIEDFEGVAWSAYHAFMFCSEGLEGATLERYLYTDVSQAVVDEMRRVDPLGAWTRSLLRKLNKAKRRIESELGREPSVLEMAKTAGVSPTAAKHAMAAAVAVCHESFDEMTELGHIGAPDSPPPGGASELRPVFTEALGCLSMVERNIIERAFFDGASMEMIAKEVGLTSARIGQIRDAALAKLRKQPAIRELSV